VKPEISLAVFTSKIISDWFYAHDLKTLIRH